MLRQLTACCHWKFGGSYRQQGSTPTVGWLAVFQDGGVHMQNMTSFNFITFAKINAKCQCYNCLNMLNMVLKRFGGTLIANDVNKILWIKFIGTRWQFVYSCRQRTVRIERCVKSAALSLFESRFSAAAVWTDTSLDTVGWVIWPVKIVPDMTYNVLPTDSSTDSVFASVNLNTAVKYATVNVQSNFICDTTLIITLTLAVTLSQWIICIYQHCCSIR